MDTYNWYAELAKPSFAPPPTIFGPVWTFLYVLIFISFSAVFILAWRKQIPRKIAGIFALNLIFNFLFTPIMFGLHSIPLATADILLVFSTLIWAMIAIYPYKKWITYIQIPYLLWVAFATILQLSIFFLN